MAASKDLELDAIQPTAASFPFKNLPPEVRHLIWDEALREESSERLVLLDHITHKVLPFKSLVSPMLTVDRESRSRAVRFFDMKLFVCKLPVSRNPWRSSFHGFFDFHEMNETPRSEKRLYLSSRHDIFMAGFELQPRAYGWSLVPSTCSGCKDEAQHMLFCGSFERTSGSFRTPADHYASQVHRFRSRIERVIAVCVDGFCSPYNTSSYCTCQPRSYREAVVDSFWSKTLFPGVKRYFYYPWGSKTRTQVADLLEHLFQRRPGVPLPAEYRMKELVWSEYVEGISGDCEEQFIRTNILVDPNLERRRPCRCMLKGIVDDEFYERAGLTIHELMERMHREALRSP
ncbi:hypothetical protein F5Y05DRAFT_419793 [Hypoxylon sp. FL0543]|nr:hypothetical protein F5Y05DRAFT_419793 [Hypoxylon sp. FL0543]